ncbi:MAG: type 1 periplasmic binding fold superfamily protein [Flavobacteriales bacterium]|nr:type 1 periplasmic binding fold superfamily protein [Flavobacteriales bacterium]
MLRPALFLLGSLILGISACETPHDEVYEEPITSLFAILTPDTGNAVILQYLDRDGQGGRPAMVNSGLLKPETTYQCQLQINTLGKHLIDSTSVTQHPELHQVFFLPQNGLQISTAYSDLDANGLPVGFHSTITTGSPSNGELLLIIKHLPNKRAVGVAQGDLTNAAGKTDLEVGFAIRISGS